MLTTLAFDNTESSMFRQLLEPITFSTKAVDSYSPSNLQSHINLRHPGNSFAGKTSLDITTAILQHQTSVGLSSDWVTPDPGFGFMADAATAIPPMFTLTTLDYPGVGGAWHYFRNQQTTWGSVVYDTVAFKRSEFLVREQSSNIQITWFKPSGVSFVAQDRVNVFNFNSANSVNPLPNPVSFPNSFTEVVPGYYSSNPALFSQTNTTLSAQNTNFIRQYYLSADSVPEGSPGLFNEAEALANPTIQEALSHIIDQDIHITLDNSKLGANSVYSGQFIRYSLLPNQYLGNGNGGDAWYDPQGNNHSPMLDLPGIQHWIAYGNNGGRVLDPDTLEVIAAPVNNETEVRCMFTLPLGSVPIVEGDIMLRCLNPDKGFRILANFIIPEVNP